MRQRSSLGRFDMQPSGLNIDTSLYCVGNARTCRG
jgi:hypothetical protein